MKPSPTVALGVAMTWTVLASAQGPAPASDPIVGTWKANLAKSTYNPGPPPPATLTLLRRYAILEGGWMQFLQTSANTDGEPTAQVGVFKIDGQRHPVHNVNTIVALMLTGQPTNVARSYRRIDAYTTESTTYNDGVAGIPVVRAVAKDGKTFTETTKGKPPQGQAVHNVVVYERVR
jgi:hypothetical protein